MTNAKIDDNYKPSLIGVSSNDGETPTRAEINPSTGRLLVDAMGGATPGIDYDYMALEQTSATVETYTFKDGGSGGTTIRTVVITYTDSGKETISTVGWS